jgi:hypothetical protein
MTVSDEDKQIVEVLALEYSALRSDILHRSAARYSLLGVFLGVAAVLVALIDNSDKISWWPTGVVILIIYVGTVALSYLDAGRSIGRLSNRLVELEDAINRKMGRSAQPLLVWERMQQEDRGFVSRVLMGRRIVVEKPR